MSSLPLERLFQSPSLSGPSPRALAYSPDGSMVTFLKAKEEDASRFDLWAFDVATGEASLLVDSRLLEPEDVALSEQEKALRERQRTAGQTGILSYDWGSADTILVPIGGDLHLVEFTNGEASSRQLTQTDAFEFDAKVSPNGNYVSFIRDNALFVIDLVTGIETQVSPDADPDRPISYGVAEFIAQEEMGRYTGYWWSPDEAFIAYTRVDESTVDIVPRSDIAGDGVTLVQQRYPKAGRPNAIVDLLVHDMSTGEASKLYSVGPDTYLARVNWAGSSLWFQTVNRDQTEIKYHRTDGSPWRIWSPTKETHDTWVNLSNDFMSLGNDQLLITRETAQGHPHTTAIGDDGNPIRVYNEPEPYRHIERIQGSEDSYETVTHGKWAVSSIAGQSGDTVFFTGYKDTPLERHLYSVPLPENGNPGEPTRITSLGSTWSVTMASDGASYIGTSSNPNQPPQTGLYKADGTLITWIEENALDADHPYTPYLADHTTPEYGTLKAEDGQDLYYSIQTPPGFDPTRKYPVIIEVYGGPHVQTVSRSWRSLSDQYLTREGYIVFRLDNRGSDNRGRKFENVIYRRMGGPEVADQLVGVDWLKSQPFVDESRIAIQGWSYGGFMVLMTMAQAPEGTFAAGVAGAPVTDYKLYDTFYTERYLDTPQDNPEGYANSSVFPFIDGLKDPLFLIHGMADDNVVFENSVKLYAELQERGIPFEMMTYPGQRHGIRGEALTTHLMKTRMAFLNRHLKAGE